MLVTLRKADTKAVLWRTANSKDLEQALHIWIVLYQLPGNERWKKRLDMTYEQRKAQAEAEGIEWFEHVEPITIHI